MHELPICGWCHQPYRGDFRAHRRNECPDMRDLSWIRPALLERVRAEARATALAEREALVAPVRALRFSAAAVHDALAYLGPTGTGAEAVVKTAALATAAILDALAKTPTKLAPSASPVKREALGATTCSCGHGESDHRPWSECQAKGCECEGWGATLAETPEAEARTCADYVALVGRLRAVIADHEDAPGSRIARYGGDALLLDLVDVLAKTPEPRLVFDKADNMSPNCVTDETPHRLAKTPEAEKWTPPDFGNDVWRP